MVRMAAFRIAADDPRIELATPRLLLRRFGADDAPLLTHLDSDPEVMRFLDGGGPARPDLDAQAVVRFQKTYEEHPGLGFFAAHLRDSGDYVGWFHFRPDRQDPAHVDLGYRLVRRAWGQGLATEGSRALIERGFQRGVPCVVAYALLANRGSWRVMEKLGMERVGEFTEERFPGPDKAAVKYRLMPPPFAVRVLESERSSVCERILRALPEWFGIESSIVKYARDVADLSVLAACEGEAVVGFLALKRHTPESCEIHVMGVMPPHHRRGIGRVLVEEAARRVRGEGARLMSVKTLAPSRPCAEYDRTRAFYRALGFLPVETFDTLWGEANPCLLMVRPL